MGTSWTVCFSWRSERNCRPPAPTGVNTGCNLDCPICFAGSGHQSDGYAITLEQCATSGTDFVAALGERNRVLGRSVNVHLQFDGFDPDSHLAIRGRDLRDIEQSDEAIR
ncbi:hypothetical protein ACQEVF_43635 [Nonomuraea polychroma]|uniref:hypothetical protein n=1 Tax=Nonomuraea polychroma TaxID=46176 RepID=UPI003D8CD2A2